MDDAPFGPRMIDSDYKSVRFVQRSTETCWFSLDFYRTGNPFATTTKHNKSLYEFKLPQPSPSSG